MTAVTAILDPRVFDYWVPSRSPRDRSVPPLAVALAAARGVVRGPGWRCSLAYDRLSDCSVRM